VVDVEAQRPRIEARLADLGRHMAEDSRDALRALVRGERLRVSPAPERRFRVDGRASLRLPAGNENARGPQSAGRTLRVVAGGRYARVSPRCPSRWRYRFQEESQRET